ncbi:MAG: hypothetical protein AAF460_15580 [Pseudomonadota bacterium]
MLVHPGLWVVVVCGISLGYAAHDDPANHLVTERAPLDDWATFLR